MNELYKKLKITDDRYNCLLNTHNLENLIKEAE